MAVATKEAWSGHWRIIKWNISVGFWSNGKSTRWGHGGDDKGDLELDGDGVKVLEIMVVSVRSLAVSKLVCQMHSMCEELGEICEVWAKSRLWQEKVIMAVTVNVGCYGGLSFKQMSWSPGSSFFFWWEHSWLAIVFLYFVDRMCCLDALHQELSNFCYSCNFSFTDFSFSCSICKWKFSGYPSWESLLSNTVSIS